MTDGKRKYLKEYLSGNASKSLNMEQIQYLMVVLLGTFHIYLFTMFLISSVEVMVFVNIFSIATYVISFFLIPQNKPKLIFAIVYLEILIHLTIGIIVLGDATGLELYLLAMIPVNYYTSYALREECGEKSSFNPLPFSLSVVILWCILKGYCSIHVPLDSFKSEFIAVTFYVINFAFVMISLIIYMSGFMIQIIHMNKMLESQNEVLKMLSRTDALTGLENRRGIDRFIGEEFDTEHKLCVVLADIDDFKQVNDTYGHDVGDSVLISIADILKGAVDKIGKVCRWGGEEILLILPGMDVQQAEGIVIEIQKQIEKTTIEATQKLKCPTMTFGIADSSEMKKIKDMIILADERLYFGKQNGKNCMVGKK